MSLLLLVPFVVFFGCVLAAFWQMKNVRNILIERHPDTFLEIEKSSMFPSRGLWNFVQGKQHEQLGDTELSAQVKKLKVIYVIAIASWIAYAIAILSNFD